MLSTGDGSSGESDDAETTTQSDSQISLSELPPLPLRGSAYRSEPLIGVCFVLTLSIVLVGITSSMSVENGVFEWVSDLQMIMLTLIWVEAFTAMICVLYLLIGNAGVIHRSEATCYPIPAEVEERLRESQSMKGLKNINGPTGSQSLGSYCIRCFVWRPPKGYTRSHHCQTCQRCVVGFDHHCGIFGRCIVRGNMPCFYTLIGMMPAAVVTAMFAVAANASEAVTILNKELHTI